MSREPRPSADVVCQIMKQARVLEDPKAVYVVLLRKALQQEGTERPLAVTGWAAHIRIMEVQYLPPGATSTIHWEDSKDRAARHTVVTSVATDCLEGIEVC